MPQQLPATLRESHFIVLDLLFTDLDLAFTMLETARISEEAETKKRAIENAVEAYNYVVFKSARIEISPQDRDRLEARLCDLATHLAALGHPV